MMRNFKEYWDLIFTQTLRFIDNLDNNSVSVTETDGSYHNKTKLLSGSHTVIDDILLFCRNIDKILIYFECVCKDFLSYRVRFRLNKCDFLKNRVKYVAHDVTKAEKCLNQ